MFVACVIKSGPGEFYFEPAEVVCGLARDRELSVRFCRPRFTGFLLGFNVLVFWLFLFAPCFPRKFMFVRTKKMFQRIKVRVFRIHTSGNVITFSYYINIETFL